MRCASGAVGALWQYRFTASSVLASAPFMLMTYNYDSNDTTASNSTSQLTAHSSQHAAHSSQLTLTAELLSWYSSYWVKLYAHTVCRHVEGFTPSSRSSNLLLLFGRAQPAMSQVSVAMPAGVPEGGPLDGGVQLQVQRFAGTQPGTQPCAAQKKHGRDLSVAGPYF